MNGRDTFLLFPAKLYCGQSLLDGRRESVIIDYAFTDELPGYREHPDSLGGRKGLRIRDEIRMVRPGFYLGTRLHEPHLRVELHALQRRRRGGRARGLPCRPHHGGLRARNSEGIRCTSAGALMPHQEALTVVAPIKPGEVEAVARVLGTIPDHVDAWDVIPFEKLPRMHFARLVVFDETKDLDGDTISAQLALMTNVDGPSDAHMRDLSQIAGARSGRGLRRVRRLSRGLAAHPGHAPAGSCSATGATRPPST